MFMMNINDVGLGGSLSKTALILYSHSHYSIAQANGRGSCIANE